MDTVMNFLKKYWPYAVVLLVGGALGYMIKPANVRIEEREKVVVVEKEVIKEVEVVKWVKDTSVKDRTHTETTTTTNPDGSSTSHTVVDTNVDTNTHETKDTVKVVEVIKEVMVTKEVEKIVEAGKANWRINAMLGTQLSVVPLGVKGFVYGGEVDRRLFGPVWIGVYGLSNGTVGGKVGIEF